MPRPHRGTSAGCPPPGDAGPAQRSIPNTRTPAPVGAAAGGTARSARRRRWRSGRPDRPKPPGLEFAEPAFAARSAQTPQQPVARQRAAGGGQRFQRRVQGGVEFLDLPRFPLPSVLCSRDHCGSKDGRARPVAPDAPHFQPRRGRAAGRRRRRSASRRAPRPDRRCQAREGIRGRARRKRWDRAEDGALAGGIGRKSTTPRQRNSTARRQTARLHGVAHQHGDGHRPDTAGHGRDGGGLRGDARVVHIAH